MRVLFCLLVVEVRLLTHKKHVNILTERLRTALRSTRHGVTQSSDYMRLLTSLFGNSHSVLVFDCWSYALILRIMILRNVDIMTVRPHIPEDGRLNSLFCSQCQFPIGMLPLRTLTRWGEVVPVLNERTAPWNRKGQWKYSFSQSERYHGMEMAGQLRYEGSWTPGPYWIPWRRWIVLPLPGVETANVSSFSSLTSHWTFFTCKSSEGSWGSCHRVCSVGVLTRLLVSVVEYTYQVP